MNLYAENILDHYRHPRHKSPLLQKAIVIHAESNPTCGDEITIGLTIKEKHICSIHWDGTGCAISQAAMSMLAEELQNVPIDSAIALTPKKIFDLLGVPISPRRTKCALLGLHTLKNTLHNYRKQSLQTWTETIAGAVDEI